jgi:Zn-dependent alcohol dehydrogenase
MQVRATRSSCPSTKDKPTNRLTARHIQKAKAIAAHYVPELMLDVLSGKLDMGAVFTKTIPLSDIAEGYKDMDERKEIQALVKP